MKNLTLAFLVCISSILSQKSFSQNVAVNSTGSNPDTSAMLDVSSTTLGFLMPRMTTTEQNAVILPANGLTIFNTSLNSIMLNIGTPLSPNWTPLSTTAIDTSSIANFYTKVRSLLSATAPITYSNGLIGITKATTAANGYLSNTDWNTFNNKVSSITITATPIFAATALTVTGGAATGTLTLNDQVRNTIFAGPVSGGVAAPTFRTLVAADLPAGTATTSNTWSILGNTGTVSATNFIGTIDKKSFKIKTWNNQGFLLDSLGNVGIGVSPTFAAGVAREKFLVDAGVTTSINAISAKGSIDNYLQLNIQNQSAGVAASSDIVSTADNGSETTKFIDMGINSSANTSIGTLGGINTAYLYATGNDFAIGNATASQSLLFFTGGTTSNKERMRIDGTGKIGIGTTTPATALHVFGTNPLTLTGVQLGTTTTLDSLLTINSGTVQKLPVSTFATPSNSWSTTGNAGTTSTTNFIGTTNNKSFKIKTNNAQGILLDSLGNVGIGISPIFTSTTARREKFLVDAGSPTDSTNSFNVISGKGYIDNYLQLNIQNRAGTGAASSDVVASNDIATEAINFIDMGINSSGNTSTGVLGGVNTAYLYATGSDFAIGNASNNKSLLFFTDGTTAAKERMRIDDNGKVGIGTTTPATVLHVFGTNPLTLTGVQAGTTTTLDSFLTINSGTVQKLAVSTFATPSNSWSTTGNAGTTSATNFIGTTNNKSFKIKTNNNQGFLLDSLGNVGIGVSPIFTSTIARREKFLVDAGSVIDSTNSYNVISGKGYIDNYLQLNIQNRAGTGAASSDVVASNDIATEAINFIDMGINSSGNTSTGVLGGVNTAYLYATGGDFAIGNASNNKSLLFFTDGTTAAKERMRIDDNGKVGIGTTTPNSTFQDSGSVALNIVNKTATYTASATDYTIICNNGAAMSVNLPTAVGITGRIYIIKKISGAALNVTINGNGAQTIDGAATKVLTVQYEKVTIQSDGSNWFIIGN